MFCLYNKIYTLHRICQDRIRQRDKQYKMLTVPMRDGIQEFMMVFAEKMREMGMTFEWSEKSNHIEIETDMGISNLLRPALGYCFQQAYVFDHKGVGRIVCKATRPPLTEDDAILHMYHKWKCKLAKRNDRE